MRICRIRNRICFLLISFLILNCLSNLSLADADSTLDMDEFPLGLVIEYDKEYMNFGGSGEDKYTVRYEVTARVEGNPSLYTVVKTVERNDDTTTETFYDDYPNGTITVHGAAPLWVDLASWNGSQMVTIGSRIYNITQYTTAGCSLHYENGDDEDTIQYDSFGVFATGYFFHFEIGSPLSTESLSTKRASSNLYPRNFSEYDWLVTAFLIPGIAIEIVIIAWLLKRRGFQKASQL